MPSAATLVVITVIVITILIITIVITIVHTYAEAMKFI